jgi:hypothetical protein
MNTANVADTLAEAFSRAAETYTTDDKHEISEETYSEALCVLPPIYGRGRFWVGEAYTHNSRGFAVCLECWQENGKYFCRLSECRNYR